MKSTTYLIIATIAIVLCVLSGSLALWFGITGAFKLVTIHPIVALGKFIWCGILLGIMWGASRIASGSLDKSGIGS